MLRKLKLLTIGEFKMGDMGEYYAELKKEAKQKKAGNIKSSEAVLKQNGVHFQKLNAYHWRIVNFKLNSMETQPVFDFWPSTGKFLNHKTKKYGRGVLNLIKELKKQIAS